MVERGIAREGLPVLGMRNGNEIGVVTRGRLPDDGEEYRGLCAAFDDGGDGGFVEIRGQG